MISFLLLATATSFVDGLSVYDNLTNITRDCEVKLDKVVRIAVLLPSHMTDELEISYHNQLERVLPGIELASRSQRKSIGVFDTLEQGKLQ